MIDRNAREKMEEAIRSYMGETLTAFEFDEALSEICERTDDKTVQHVGRVLWYLYDDITDHRIGAHGGISKLYEIANLCTKHVCRVLL